jgi:predicted ATP-dependent serine protease
MSAPLRDLEHAAGRARDHGLHVERLGYGLAVGCPACRNGQDVILRMDAGMVTGACERCGSGAVKLAELLLAEPFEFDSSLKRRPVTKEKVEGSVVLPFAPISRALAGTSERPDWLWDGYVATGAVTLLAGRPKVGKSTLLFAWASAVTHGRPLLGSATRTAKVLLLSEERGDTLREKRERWRLTDDVHLLMRHQAGREKWPAVVEHCTAYCIEHDLAAIVVDTWDKWAGLAGDSENSSGSVLEALRPLTDAAAKGLAVLVSAHQRKSLGEYGEAVRGSNALTGAVDVIVEIERATVAEGGSARVLRTVSRFDQAPPDELVVMLDESGYQARGSLSDVHSEDEREAVFTALADAGGPLTAEEAAAAADIPKATAHKRLGELKDAGRVTRTGEGKKGKPYKWQLFSFVTALPLSDETNIGGAS